MRLVHKEQPVVGEIVEQGVGRRADRPAREYAGVVLDPRAEADLAQHLEVVLCPFLDALGLKQLVVGLEVGHPLLHLALNFLQCRLTLFVRYGIVGCRVDGGVVQLADQLAGQGVDFADPVDLVAEKFDADGVLARRCGEDLDGVPPHAELVAHEVDVVALIADGDQPAHQRVAAHGHARAHRQHQRAVFLGVAERINAGHRRNDNDVPPLE